MKDQLSIKIPTNVEIIRHHQDNGNWPNNAISIELKSQNRWLMAIPHQGAWNVLLMEPHSEWKQYIKQGMTTPEVKKLLNKVVRDKTLYKSNSRSAHITLIKSFIK
jgi:hypothetical protein